GVHDGAVLDVRAAADPDHIHVAADDGAHPDTALLADLHVADDLRAFVDERGGMDPGRGPPVRPKHPTHYTVRKWLAGRQPIAYCLPHDAHETDLATLRELNEPYIRSVQTSDVSRWANGLVAAGRFWYPAASRQSMPGAGTRLPPPRGGRAVRASARNRAARRRKRAAIEGLARTPPLRRGIDCARRRPDRSPHA